jgi:branched-chain amino acid transport system permease protein
MRFMQILANGFISGLLIALLANGFQIVYLPTRVFFVGLAGLYTFAPYLYMASQAVLGHWFVSAIITMVAVAGLALFFEWANHAPLARKAASDGAQLIASLGTYIMLVQVVVMVWGNSAQTLRTGMDTTVDFGAVVLAQSQLLAAAVACAYLFNNSWCG